MFLSIGKTAFFQHIENIVIGLEDLSSITRSVNIFDDVKSTDCLYILFVLCSSFARYYEIYVVLYI